MNEPIRLSRNNKLNLQNKKFIISVKDLYELIPNEISKVLQNASKKNLTDLHLFDLALSNGQPLTSAGGVYLFFTSDNTCLYIGKATSRSFISRIPAHFDPRPDSWFATFPNKVLKMGLADNYDSALLFCHNCSVLLLKFDCDRDCKNYAGIIETYLRVLLKPVLNPSKHSKCLLPQQKLQNYLQIK